MNKRNALSHSAFPLMRAGSITLFLVLGCSSGLTKDESAAGSGEQGMTTQFDPTTLDPTEESSGTDLDVPPCSNMSMSEATSTGNTTDYGDGLCVGHSIAEGCCCFDAQINNKDIRVVCDVPFPCPTIELHCTSVSLSACGELTTACGDAIECALDVLAKGETAGIRWGYDHNNYQGEKVTLYLTGNGTGFIRKFSWVDVSAHFDSIESLSLKPKDYFLECKSRATAMERFDCVEHALASLEGPSKCFIDGFGFDYY